MQIEQVDLAALAETIDRALEGRGAEGFVRGRTAIRDAVLAHLACSELEAEQLVDTMVTRGFLRFSGDPSEAEGSGVWRVERPPA